MTNICSKLQQREYTVSLLIVNTYKALPDEEKLFLVTVT